MRLIDADALLAKVQENAPGFMDSGSTITKAFIMAMINTKSVAPTIDAVPVTRCKDCINYGNNGCRLKRMAYQTAPDWFCADGEPKDDSTGSCGPDYCELNLDGDET